MWIVLSLSTLTLVPLYKLPSDIPFFTLTVCMVQCLAFRMCKLYLDTLYCLPFLLQIILEEKNAEVCKVFRRINYLDLQLKKEKEQCHRYVNNMACDHGLSIFFFILVVQCCCQVVCSHMILFPM
jgi:hypothetical protein